MYVLVYASCFEMYGHIYTHIDTYIYIYAYALLFAVLGLQGFSIQDPDRPYFVAGSFKPGRNLNHAGAAAWDLGV